MDSKLEAEYKAGLRRLLSSKGAAVEISNGERKQWPNSPEMWVSTYGWKDQAATDHFLKVGAVARERYGKRYPECELIIPEGVELTEVSYSEFQDTFSDNAETVGVNAYGGEKGEETEIRCSCGKFRALTIRFEGTLREALEEILGLDKVKFTL